MQPSELTPREAWKRYVDRRRTESTDHSVKTYHYRLKQLVQWCEEEGIETVGEFSGWEFERYETKRAGDGLEPVTLAGEMKTLRNFIQYLERIEAVDDDLSEKVHVPKVSPDEQSSDKKLHEDRAIALLQYYRANEYGSRRHVLFEVFWFTGARLGAVRGLDVRDFHQDEGYIEFKHRPETGTPLKKKMDGERPVSLPDETVGAIQAYLAGDRWKKHDEYGREPLITSRQGRLGMNTVRVLMYLATLPCRHQECPHGKNPDTCEFTHRHHASKCPSSRSPHQIRTGSITWQVNNGLPPEVVAERANTSVRTIERHYDKATPLEKMERRRRQYLKNLSIDP